MREVALNTLNKGTLKNCLLFLLLITLVFLIETAQAESLNNNQVNNKINKSADDFSQNILIFHDKSNEFHRYIVKKITDKLAKTHPATKIIDPIRKPDFMGEISLILAIGTENIHAAINQFPNEKKLLITNDSATYSQTKKTDDNSSIMYMAQPYCRQLQFISLLNNKWKKISFLSSNTKPVDEKVFENCSNSKQLKTYHVKLYNKEDLTIKIKDAVDHSDLLLALPDKNIYNSHTVKNILLTSYRHRTPVIAFSKNFANSGALASIYSNKEQIAGTITSIIVSYLNSGYTFNKRIYYPEEFSITTNKQVFKALGIKTPDLDKIKEKIVKFESNKKETIR